MMHSRPRLPSYVLRLSPGLLAGVLFAHVGLLVALLYTQRSAEPIALSQTLTVSLIVPEVEAPAPQPKPMDTRLPPRVQVAERAASTLKSAIDAPSPALAPNPVPVVQANAARSAHLPLIQPSPADYLNNPRPPYPSLSRRLGEQGIVRLNVLINQDGSVARLNLLKSSGYPRLDKSAIETVQSSWKFEPARQGGRPVAAWVIVPIQFTLRS